MRTFFRGKGESVVINGDISVTILDIDIDGDEVTLAIDAPEWMEIDEVEAGRLEDVLEEWSLLQPR
jgi:carbon storage regulator CsrA